MLMSCDELIMHDWIVVATDLHGIWLYSYQAPMILDYIQLSIQYGDIKEQHSSDSFGQIVHMHVSIIYN